MANNYSKRLNIHQNDPSIVKLLTVFFLIAKKLKARILSPVPDSTQRTFAVNLSKCFIIALLLLVMGVGSVKGITKSWVPTFGEQYTTSGFKADGSRENIQATKEITYFTYTHNE